MVLSLGNTIIMPRGLYIQLVQGRNKTPFSVGYAYLRECVPVTKYFFYKFVFTFFNEVPVCKCHEHNIELFFRINYFLSLFL